MPWPLSQLLSLLRNSPGVPGISEDAGFGPMSCRACFSTAEHYPHLIMNLIPSALSRTRPFVSECLGGAFSTRSRIDDSARSRRRLARTMLRVSRLRLAPGGHT